LPLLPTQVQEINLDKIIAYYRHYYPQALADFLVEEFVLPSDTQKMERRFFSALVLALATQDEEERGKAMVISWNHMVQTVYVAMVYVCEAFKHKLASHVRGRGKANPWINGLEQAQRLYREFIQCADRATELAGVENQRFKANGGAHTIVSGGALAIFQEAIDRGKHLMGQLDLTKAVMHEVYAVATREERWRGVKALLIFLSVYIGTVLVIKLLGNLWNS
jgi:hypothetical protein